MPLKPHQRELISGKYIGQSIDFKKIPRADEWDNLVKTALKGLSTFASPGRRKRLTIPSLTSLLRKTSTSRRLGPWHQVRTLPIRIS